MTGNKTIYNYNHSKRFPTSPQILAASVHISMWKGHLHDQIWEAHFSHFTNVHQE